MPNMSGIARTAACLIILGGGLVTGCTSFGGSYGELADQLESKAIKGDAESQYRLGLYYTNSKHPDHEQATRWFQEAARQGNRDAQYMLAINYYTGQGVAKDDTQARKWFLKAAYQGHARAQYQLGEIYLNGRGVRKEPAWAAYWYGKAAEQKHAQAQLALAISFARGLGLPINPIRACEWVILAEQSGASQAAAVKAKLCAELSDQQLSRAQHLAGIWRVHGYPFYKDPPTTRYIQYRLRLLGYYPGYVDGVKGEQTRVAIDNYLADHGVAELATRELLARLRKETARR